MDTANPHSLASSQDSAEQPYDLDRLERALEALVASREDLLRENAALREQLAVHEHRVRELDEQLLDASRRRQEAGKRLDELIAQLDHLENQLDGASA